MTRRTPDYRRALPSAITLAIVAMTLLFPGLSAFAQDRDPIRSLFPRTLTGLELTEYYDPGHQEPHYGPAIQRLPVRRVVGVYSDGADAAIIVQFVMTDPALTGLFPEPNHGALELAQSAPGDLERADSGGLIVYQGVRALDIGGTTEESLQLVVSLGGHAAISMSAQLPSSLTLDRMRAALGELDVAAFQAAADAAADIPASAAASGTERFWRALALLPADLLGEARTMVFIDSDGRRTDRGVSVMGAYGGDTEDPAVILHVASFPQGMVTTAALRERYGIAPSDQPDRTVGDRPLFHLHGGEFDGAVALFDGSVVLALIPLAGQSPDTLADALVGIAGNE
ncbi:MAG: hypothetical protein EA382_06210 [Spirochaetaceae bacterium]|nr:MAG: hypothetical protein EA382_06210 [Spirochaetaceae bacterium]